MMESLRGLGYSTAGALADIIDNSITAGARTVDLDFRWSGDSSSISVLDDGSGMDENALEKAMRLGGISPLRKRASRDLGRFGMGLKTASLSQCRRLTVCSRRLGTTHCLRWDLDFIAKARDDGWHLLDGPAAGSEDILSSLASMDKGTLVLWERLDKIVTPGFNEQDFLDLVDKVDRHLSMVFHRFLTGPSPKLRLRINGRSVRPWDPFLEGNAATWSSPVERIAMASGPVEIRCHVLPHKDRLDEREAEDAAGPGGWIAQQGFYVYRGARLLVPGSWLGLGRRRPWAKQDAYQLARIRLDIPNTADSDWKIDIRKSTARPPLQIRARLLRLGEDTRNRARRVITRRRAWTPHRAEPITQAWRVEHFTGGMRYRIDLAHPAVEAVLSIAGPIEPQIRAMFQVLEETVPVQRMWTEAVNAQEASSAGSAERPPRDVARVLSAVYRNLVFRKGISPALARESLLRTEPFNNYPDLVATLPDDPSHT